MPYTDLTFFTNEPERTLYDRFSCILRSNTQFFDILVGYFRTSGFFKLYEAMESVEKIRIIVGLDVDHYTVKIIDRANEEIRYEANSTKVSKDVVSEKIEKEFEDSINSAEVEKGVRTFIDWLKSGKLEMRMYAEAPIHAKVYIMRKNPELVPDTYGSVITGSSNFSQSGLINNLEFNVELKDSRDVTFALERFEDLWTKSVDIKDTYIETVEQKTWLKGDITPYQLYLKTLYEFFKEEINSDKELNFDTLLPDGYMKLQYQLDAVVQAKQKLEAYNGVFISDVVGLGKTYICALLANSFNRNTRKLIICPPVLVDYWTDVLKEFDVSRCDVESLGKLDKIISKGTEKYDYIFIDEAHRFRNQDTESFKLLHQICFGKKVVLISATPINNYTSDIENQIYLFQSKQNGTINGVKNLEGFFRGLNTDLKKHEKGTPAYMTVLRKNSEIIRDKLIREVMIRRTRSEIVKYYEKDLKTQGLTFPTVGKPEQIIYTFDEDTDSAFKETIGIIKRFNYARYAPLLYLKDKKKYAKQLTAQHNMGGFMKGILVKRLESSFFAFKMTLGRFATSYEKFIAMAQTGKIYISKKYDVYDLLDDGNDDKLFKLVDEAEIMCFDTSEFSPHFLTELASDLAQLKYLIDLWNGISSDPKLLQFIKELKTNDKLIGNKKIIFTESRETAEYLSESLIPIYGDRVVNFSGMSSRALKEEIEDSFNPKNHSKKNDRFDVLISTDVLAEGVNLHRANALINYDLPWNPTKIMQRVGRINRVGTEYDKIYVFNFFPTAQSDKHLPLTTRIMEKLQAFHDTLGEDIKYLSDEEEVSSQKLFADLTQNLDEDEQSINPELAYLAIIRDVRDNNTDLFETIKRLPKKAKAGKLSQRVADEATISFIRKGALKLFYFTSLTTTEQLTFINAIEYIKSEIDENSICVGKCYYDHLDANSNAFDDYLIADDEISFSKPMIAGNDAKVIKYLKSIKSTPQLTDDQENKIEDMIALWENGEIPDRISKEALKAARRSEDGVQVYYEILNLIPSNYFAGRKNSGAIVDGEKQVILSCFLRKDV